MKPAFLALSPLTPLLLSCLVGALACGGESHTPAAAAAATAPAPPAASVPAASDATADSTADSTATAAPASPLPEPDLGYNERQGRVLFQHYCATCHGAEGRGDGLNSYSLDPKPRDLSDPTFQAQRSDDDLASIVRIGGGAAGLSTGMPPWGHTLNERQIHNLVLYVRTFKPEPSSDGTDQ